MKRIASSAILAAFVAVSATAQDKAPSEGNAAMDAASQQQKPAKLKLKLARHRGMATADARACLQFTTNVEITRCAEKYL